MKVVLVNVTFRDKYTGTMYEAGKTYPMSEERVKEVKEVNSNFVTVIGEVPVPAEETPDVDVPEAPEVPDAEPKKKGKK